MAPYKIIQGQFIQKFVISKNVLNLEAGVRCVLLYFEEKQNTNYFDQSEAVKAPINLLMYRSFRNCSDTKIHCFYIYTLLGAGNINMSVRSILRILPLQSFVIFVTFNCDEICWGVSCAVLTANLLPVVRYVPTFHPSEANELINLPLTPSFSEHLLSPSPTGRGERCSVRSLADLNKTKEGNFDKKIQKNSKYSLFSSNPTVGDMSLTAYFNSSEDN